MDILADTNILLRRIHRRDPQHRQSRDAVNRLVNAGHRVCVTSQNLMELWAVCTRPVDSNGLGLSTPHAERILARVERSVVRLPDSDNIYAEWRRLVSVNNVAGKKTHDARLAAAMNVHTITHILTFNRADFSRFPGITVVEPNSLDQAQGLRPLS